MEYIKLEHLKYFIEEADQKYNVGGPGVAFFKDTKDKLGYLINELSSHLNIPFVVNYTELPHIQPNRNRPPTLKNYILMGFIPKKYLNHLEKQVFVKIELDVKNRLPKLFIELDTNLKIKDNEYNVLKEELNKATHWQILIDENFPGNWQQLITLCLPPIKKCLSNLDSLVENKLKQKHPNLNRISVTMDSTKETMPLNQILYGPPGTGKTYNTVNKALEILGVAMEGKTRKEIKDLYDGFVESGQITFTTFHQSMSYEDFIEGIKPLKPSGDDRFLKYDVEDGIFKKLCGRAGSKNTSNFRKVYDQFITQLVDQENELLPLKTPSDRVFHVNVNTNDNLNLYTGKESSKQGVLTADNLEKFYLGEKVFKGWQGYAIGVLDYLKSNFNLHSEKKKDDQNYVLIIDEINRGNVSQIFGELITLIEDDKRQGRDEALEVILPYSKDKFSVPQNLYIIGTMNTADRSVEALDAALRRRFSFTEMPPMPELIANEGRLKDYGGMLENFNLPELLSVINRRIEKLLDKDHAIGHSYFMKVEKLRDLKFSFQHEIIPLLQEYFFGDYGKIGLVLGRGFVSIDSNNDEADTFADFDYLDSSALSERIMYKIEEVVKMDDERFIDALSALQYS
jgi:hypothetical protein